MRGTGTGAALDASSRLARTADGLLTQGAEEVRVWCGAIKTLESREKQLSENLAHCREGREAASPLLDALRAKGQRAVALGRVVEVTTAGGKWWPLLQSLLARDRQSILVMDFAAAWEIAQRVASPGEPLLHPGELAGLTTGSGPGSLRQFLETAHPGASAWLDVRLGDVIPVKNVQDLDRHPRALPADGWLKDPPRRERLVPAQELTLGENGLRRLRENREVELDVIREKLPEAERTKRELNRAMDCEIAGWRYQIRSTSDRSYAAIWALVDKGLPSGEDMGLFNAAASEEIERAKAELMAATEAAEQGGETRPPRIWTRSRRNKPVGKIRCRFLWRPWRHSAGSMIKGSAHRSSIWVWC